VYLVGCGGSLVTMYSTEYLLERHGAAFPAFLLTSGDFVYRRPAQLGPGSLVVAVSHTGGTAETVEAARVPREAGATVISVSRHADCPLSGIADTAFDYANEDPRHGCEVRADRPHRPRASGTHGTVRPRAARRV
jgi:fructoselysine 6-phosphate deglycase